MCLTLWEHYRAILQKTVKKDNISILAPEIILLYKSRNPESKDYKHDFDLVIDKLEEERYEWSINAMNIEYPEGHPWIKSILRKSKRK